MTVPSRIRRRSTVTGLATVLLLLSGAPALAAEPAPNGPGSDPWQQVARDQVAEQCGLDPDLLDAVAPELAQTPYTVVRYGKQCWSGGYPGGTAAPYAVHSITKTLGAILFGMIASRSELDDTDPVTEWIPTGELGNINPDATLAHVLAMTATKPDLRPGKKGQWVYDTSGDREINTLVGVMNRAIDQQPAAFPGVADARQFAEHELFAPLGMTKSAWPGTVIGYSMISTVEDMSRMGLLLLRKGEWDGKQLLDESFVYRMTHPAFEDTNTGYGYLTQMNAEKGWTYSSGSADLDCSPYVSWPRYPHAPFFEPNGSNGGSPFPAGNDIGLTWAAGAGGQKISVHRGLDLIITVRDDVVDSETGGTFEGHKRPWRIIRPSLVALDPLYRGDEGAFCAAYQRSAHAPDLLSPWSAQAPLGGPATAAAPAGTAPPAASPSSAAAGAPAVNSTGSEAPTTASALPATGASSSFPRWPCCSW